MPACSLIFSAVSDAFAFAGMEVATVAKFSNSWATAAQAISEFTDSLGGSGSCSNAGDSAEILAIANSPARGSSRSVGKLIVRSRI